MRLMSGGRGAVLVGVLLVALAVAAPAAAEDDLWVQSSAKVNGAFTSTDFDGDGQHDAGTQSDATAVDDFVVPSGVAGWSIESIIVSGMRWRGSSPPEVMYVWFYRDRGGTPSGAAPIASRRGYLTLATLTGVVDEASGTVRLASPVRLLPGKYWVGIQSAARPWSWMTVGDLKQVEAPAQIYGCGGAESWWWVTRCSSFLNKPGGRDLVFTLRGRKLDGLVFQKQGTGDGTVFSRAPVDDIRCRTGECKAKGVYFRFPSGDTVTLLVRSVPVGSVFAGWDGCDAVLGPTGRICRVTMNSPGRSKNVRAKFDVAGG